jgi:two-component system phosphate regulon sensor histidine kinase PhoR
MNKTKKTKRKTLKQVIYRKMSQALALAIFLTAFLCTLFLYIGFEKNSEESIEAETRYIKLSIEQYGINYLYDIKNDNTAEKSIRITLIASDGTVIYDTSADAAKMDNHKEREEVREALEYGEGNSRRKSDTLSKNTYYYAVLLKDGNVLRVSDDMESFYVALIKAFFTSVTIGIIVFIFGNLLSYMIVDKIVKPINSINLEKPENNQVYPEFKPLLKRIQKQNDFIREQTITENESRERMRREFSANVSHELKTPLTSISGYAEIMKTGVAKPEDMVRFSEIIYLEATRMITLVEDIIKVSKLDEEKNQVDWQIEQVDLYKMCEETINRLEHAASKRNVVVMLSGSTQVIEGERYILSEMVYNITENAIKYNKENGRVWVKVYEDEGHKIVEVVDTGIGIDDSDKSRVFERFYRVDKSHSRAIGGTGLGLSIVKHGAIFHNATIKLDSKLGEGTTIKLIF